MLELVDRIILRFIDNNHKRSSRFSDKGDIVLMGKTVILHIIILGSNPNISTLLIKGKTKRVILKDLVLQVILMLSLV
jgi:hypothetical protein